MVYVEDSTERFYVSDQLYETAMASLWMLPKKAGLIDRGFGLKVCHFWL